MEPAAVATGNIKEAGRKVRTSCLNANNTPATIRKEADKITQMLGSAMNPNV
eukprot:CAMPEP_0181469082 /NCGR_PEP_ID=MMETSP1110-20121109/37826_1 /TAXON_ID=174948 /ORGANISM="Symbiodinium sp., Strain CCMP421" /LENGTH=51 /DNA_ID=CAMNT_0023593959 /DNA_START=557 /DNA_END=712 /DNA_ORIENTATION=-